jgi:RNA polymerase sigma-70 factor (ECF subfamily)
MHHSRLIDQAKLGDRQAIAGLLDGYRNYLQLIAQIQTSKTLQGKVEASDLVQETCLAAYRDIGQFRGQSEQELLGWLRRIMANTGGKMIRHYQTLGRDVHREQELAAGLDRSAAALSGLVSPVSTPSQGAAVILADKMAELPDHYREALVFHHLKGLSIAEVAEKLGRSPEATNSLLARALIKLRLLMKDAA